MSELRINILGEERVLSVLRGMEDRASDLRPAWDRVARDMMEMEEEVFASEGASIGENWPPLSARYARWKAGHYPGRPLLVASGALKASLTEESSSRMILDRQPDSLTFGSAAAVGPWYLGTLHQLGTRRMPARPVIPQDADRAPRAHIERWVQFIGEHLMEGL